MPRKTNSIRSASPVLTAVVLLVLGSLFLLLPGSTAGAFLARKSYDLLFLIAGGGTRPDRQDSVAVVYVDARTFSSLGRDPSLPLDRRVYASLVRRAKSAGAVAVVFDIIFEKPAADPAEDQEFAAAIRENGKVILGAEWHRSELDTGGDTQVMRKRSTQLPNRILLEAAAGYGLTFAKIDPDLVVREYFPGFTDRGLPSLTWSAARLLSLPVSKSTIATTQQRWVNYHGPALTLPNVSLVDALDARAVPAEFFKGRVLFVGARPAAGRFDERRDEWRSPFSSNAGGVPFMPSVEVHATQMANLIDMNWLVRPRFWQEAIGFSLLALVVTLMLFAAGPIGATVLCLAGEAVVIGASVWMFSSHQVWTPWLIAAVVQLPAALGLSFLNSSLDWYRQRQALQRRIREQAALIDKAQDAILVSTLAGSVYNANPRAKVFYQFGDTALEDLSIQQPWFAQEAAALDKARKAVLVDGEWGGEITSVLPDGKAITVESRWTLIRDDDDHPLRILHIHTDITEKKRIQEQFLRVQRMETIGAVAGGMAHDLNNALGPVLMGVQRLRKAPQEDETRQMLSTMEGSLRRGVEMVRQVLLFTRGRDADRAVVEAGALLREMERLLKQSFPPQIKSSVIVPGDLWNVMGNATQLHQVLLNLCVNARDAMPGGGEINLAADNVELTAAEAAGLSNEAREGRYLLMVVSDTGPGMTPEVKNRLFEPFFSTKAAGAGTGLGLSTTAGIVKAHGGFIVVSSQLGEGSSFEVYLPAIAAPGDQIPTSGQHGRGELLLVALEEEAVRQLVSDGLRDLGYQTLLARHPAEILAVAKERGSALRVCIVDATADIQQLSDKLRVISPHLQLLIVSSESLPAPVPEAVSLIRPFSLQNLAANLAGLLRTPR